jgi:hypothetical protein
VENKGDTTAGDKVASAKEEEMDLFLFMFLLLCSAFASGLSLLVNRPVAALPAPNMEVDLLLEELTERDGKYGCEVSHSTSQEN